MNVRVRNAKRYVKDKIKKIFTRKYCISLKHIMNKKRYYIIRRNPPWAGFFANYLYVAAHIEYALKKGYIPVVDMENYPTFYNEDEEFMGTKNAWEYYFEQPMQVGIKEAYQSKNYIISDISTMHKYLPYYEDYNFFKIDWSKGKILSKHIEEYIRLKPNVLEVVDPFIKKHFQGKKIVGVHYRGTDKKVQVKDHFMAANLESYVKAVKKCLAENQVDAILLCTDEEEAIKKFELEFPNLLFYSSSFRALENDTTGIHLKKNVIRNHHKYLLGLEVLSDMLYLAKCDYFVFSHSNVANAALFVNNQRYKKTYFVEE